MYIYPSLLSGIIGGHHQHQHRIQDTQQLSNQNQTKTPNTTLSKWAAAETPPALAALALAPPVLANAALKGLSLSITYGLTKPCAPFPASHVRQPDNGMDNGCMEDKRNV
ncbi:uncharacterized protein RCC_01818 [Ramularia collo-cygni]|uniref:Uncharacterized protein n=1 Tax=Ramularia collo-cygni TaxID=112498 RepID=A0A2D3UPQ2_9PEZI|nr:uncharacterized protein RCC_01818 [Ramularia collo-cygni]CZT15978.1 uncharacterized protein RCC_01818 [Ramularia collo-cygni]